METDSQRFRDLTLGGFADRLASAAPVPGGGSASAVAAALGAGLVAMVAALSANRPKYAEYAATHEVAEARGRELVDRFLSLADRDSEAYAGLAAALKLPKESDHERTARTTAIESAAKVAAEVPMACVEGCLELVDTADMLAGRSNINAASDLSVASLLVEAAAQGAAANVLVNLPSVGDERFATDMTARVDRLVADVAVTAKRVRDVVASRDARPPLPMSNR